MSRRQTEYACKRLHVGENVSQQELDVSYKALVANTSDSSELDELYTLYSFMKVLIKSRNSRNSGNSGNSRKMFDPFYDTFNPYHGFDSMIRQMNYIHDKMMEESLKSVKLMDSNLTNSPSILKYLDLNESNQYENQTNTPKSNTYERRFVKQIVVNNGKAETKTYKEINKNGRRFYEEKVDDGKETKVKRITANGEVKEYTQKNPKGNQRLIDNKNDDKNDDIDE